MKRNRGPHMIDLAAFADYHADTLLAAGSGKRLIVRHYPLADKFVYILTVEDVATEFSVFAESVTAYNADGWS